MKTHPFVWITSCFILGILFGQQVRINVNVTTLLLLFSFFLIFVVLVKTKHTLYFLLLSVAWMMSGFFLEISQINYKEQWINNEFINDSRIFRARVLDVREAGRFWKCRVKARLYHSERDGQPEIQMQCYLEMDSLGQKPGNDILFYGKPDTLSPPLNPGEFNFKKFMYHKGIVFQLFVPAEKWRNFERTTAEFDFNEWLHRSRTTFLERISSGISGTDAAALVQAMTLGERENLQSDVLSAFSHTGTRHLLTVSGMHVGMLMLLVDFLIGLLPWRVLRSGRVKIILVLLTVWYYAGITGAQPATLRAAFMISLLVLSRTIKGSYHSMNALFLSALVLLVINPDLLFQLSFIFSYTALLSILLFYKPIFSCWKPRVKVLTYLWQMLALSFAAQMLILPVSIFYFHTLPLLFPITALFATPMAFLLLALTVIYLTVSLTIPQLGYLPGLLLEAVANLFLRMVRFLDDLPFGTIQDLYPDVPTLMSILILAFVVFAWMQKPLKSHIYLSGFITIALAVYLFYQEEENRKQQFLCVYADRKCTQMDIIHGKKAFAWNNGMEKQPRLQNLLENNRKRRQVEEFFALDQHLFPEMEHEPLPTFLIGGTTISILDEKGLPPVFPDTIDHLLLTTDNWKDLDSLSRKTVLKKIVLPMQLKKSTVSKAHSLNIPVWDISKSGAYVYTW